jgi:hypothetical protein
VLFEPVKIPFYDEDDYYVDGGVISNFPIHCFDGMYVCYNSKVRLEVWVDRSAFILRDCSPLCLLIVSHQNSLKDDIALYLYINTESEGCRNTFKFRRKKEVFVIHTWLTDLIKQVVL